MIQELLAQASNPEVQSFITTTMKKHLDKLTQGEAEHIIDYLNSDEAPTRLRRMSIQTAKEKASDWVERMNKKAQGIVETDQDTEVIQVFASGNKLVRLVGEAAYQREGLLMSHCVGSYYGKDVEIYSIRDSKNNPHCTIEITRNSEAKINQVKGKGNGEIHPKYIADVLQALTGLDMNIRSSEMQYLGYVMLSPEIQKDVDIYFNGAKYITFGGEQYMYKKSKLVRKKAV